MTAVSGSLMSRWCRVPAGPAVDEEGRPVQDAAQPVPPLPAAAVQGGGQRVGQRPGLEGLGGDTRRFLRCSPVANGNHGHIGYPHSQWDPGDAAPGSLCVFTG